MIKKVGVVVNLKKKNAAGIFKRVKNWLGRRKVKVLSDLELPREAIPGAVDLVVVLGGDGTLLNVARHVVLSKNNPPILGVNLGGLGFLTEITLREVYRRLDEILKGKMQISSRMVLQAEIKKGNSREVYPALNDVVFGKGARSRIINLKVAVRDELISSYLGDGLIVSSATGSTAHSLSAGGPIVNPLVEAILITPICAHTLTQRPLIISDRETLTVTIAANSEGEHVAVMIDGQTGIDLQPKDTVRIKKYPVKLKLVISPDCSYFRLLREKLSWGVRRA